MRINSKMMIALGCVSLLAMSVPALGKPKPQEAKSKSAIHSAAQAKANAKAKNRIVRDDRSPRLASFAMAPPLKPPTFGWPVLVSEARKYMGTNPTDRKRLWCATFMNMVLAKAGYSGTNSDAAKSFAQYGRRISEPKVGAIAVLTRGKKGGHVGVVTGVDANGNPIIISGNHNKRVGEATYARSRVIAYVMPAERGNTQLAGGKSLDLGFDSPIAELIAAIEAESAPVRLPPGANANARQVPAQAPAASRRHIELDPVIADFLGIKPRGQTVRVAPVPQPQVQPQIQPQPQVLPQPAPQRELRVEQQSSGRVASDAGLASRLLPVSR
jgi:uncharacterized protein (TIGR02594 family)